MSLSPDDFTLVREDSVIAALSPSLGLPIEESFMVTHRGHGFLGRIIFHPDRQFITVVGSGAQEPIGTMSVREAAGYLLQMHRATCPGAPGCAPGDGPR